MTPLRLGVLATHPIQYHAPLYRALAATNGVDLTVFFCHRPNARQQGAGFGVAFEWDTDLLSGYRHVWLRNVSREPSVTSFFGCDTPEVGGRLLFPDAGKAFGAFVVHGWAWKSCWQAFRGCWRTGTPLVVRSDSQLPQGRLRWPGRLKQTAKRMLYPQMMKRFDLCLAYGQRSAEYFRHYGARRIAIAPHFVDNDFFAERARELRPKRVELRRKWGVPETAFCLLFCGKFDPVKRPLDVLAALGAVAVAGSSASIHLLMVGDGRQRRECEDYARSHALPVSFAGFLNQGELPAAYAASDALVLCSESETWGLVVNEAMACGLPVIVSSGCGCVPDLMDHGRTGLVFPGGDHRALADCIDQLRLSGPRLGGVTAAARLAGHTAAVATGALLDSVEHMLAELGGDVAGGSPSWRR